MTMTMKGDDKPNGEANLSLSLTFLRDFGVLRSPTLQLHTHGTDQPRQSLLRHLGLSGGHRLAISTVIDSQPGQSRLN